MERFRFLDSDSTIYISSSFFLICAGFKHSLKVYPSSFLFPFPSFSLVFPLFFFSLQHCPSLRFPRDFHFFAKFSPVFLLNPFPFILLVSFSCFDLDGNLFLFVTCSCFDLFCYLFLYCSGLLPCHALILFVTFSCFVHLCYLFLF